MARRQTEKLKPKSSPAVLQRHRFECMRTAELLSATHAARARVSRLACKIQGASSQRRLMSQLSTSLFGRVGKLGLRVRPCNVQVLFRGALPPSSWPSRGHRRVRSWIPRRTVSTGRPATATLRRIFVAVDWERRLRVSGEGARQGVWLVLCRVGSSLKPRHSANVLAWTFSPFPRILI